jgi:hypothetical protein
MWPATQAMFDGGEIFKKTPCIAGLKLAGRDVAKHMLEIASIPLLIKTLLDHGQMQGSSLTVPGRLIAENSNNVTWYPHQNVVCSAARPGAFNGDGVGSEGIPVAGGLGAVTRSDVKLTENELSARTSKPMGRATHHTSRMMWKDGRAEAAVDGAMAGVGRDHENNCDAHV